MKKKTMLTLLVLTVLFIAIGSSALWATKQTNIAMVLWRGITEAEKGFQARLKESDQYDVQFTVFDANQDKKNLAKIIEDLDTNKYDLIYTFGTTVTKQVKNKVKDVPVVFNIVSRPVKAKVIDSWEHSGSNVTGASNAVPMASAFNSLSKVLYIGRLGFLYNSQEANSKIQLEEVEKLQEIFG